MSYEQILYEVTDPVATITLNRPEALNAWTPQMGAELADAAGRADRDRAVVGIVLTGAGRGFFEEQEGGGGVELDRLLVKLDGFRVIFATIAVGGGELRVEMAHREVIVGSGFIGGGLSGGLSGRRRSRS